MSAAGPQYSRNARKSALIAPITKRCTAPGTAASKSANCGTRGRNCASSNCRCWSAISTRSESGVPRGPTHFVISTCRSLRQVREICPLVRNLSSYGPISPPCDAQPVGDARALRQRRMLAARPLTGQQHKNAFHRRWPKTRRACWPTGVKRRRRRPSRRATATEATPISGPPAHGRAFAALPTGCGLIADLLGIPAFLVEPGA